MGHRFQYRLRSLSLLLLVAACGFGVWRWWATHIPTNVRRAQQALHELVENDSLALARVEGNLQTVRRHDDELGVPTFYVGNVRVDARKRTFYLFVDFDHGPNGGYDMYEFVGTFNVRPDGTWKATVESSAAG